jgi:serine/threonine protein phosphatase 1
MPSSWRFWQRSADPRGSLPPGLRIYAIGDIHGRADLLTVLHARIQRDAAERTGNEICRIVYLGDYVDRGRDSRGVIETLLAPMPGFERVFLCGNHDDMMRRFLRQPGLGPDWMALGGDATLLSYGVRFPFALPAPARWQALSAAFEARLPPAHRAFLDGLAWSHEAGDYLFVHAGLRPDRPLEDQDHHDLLWIREEFLNWRGSLAKIVVHGHSPSEKPSLAGHRIGIDTGAYASGVLTCLVLDGQGRRFLATHGRPMRLDRSA